MNKTEETLYRGFLVDEIRKNGRLKKRLLKKLILEQRRADLLATEVLGLQIKPFHRAMQRFALQNNETLQLAFRGCGKTTTVTVVLAVLHILLNPNVRILIASRTHKLAKEILQEIRGHLENPELVELFGKQVGTKWDNESIIVAGRTKPAKEATVSTIGTEGQAVGRHYNIIFGDDLIDEHNARTVGQREQVQTFYYKALTPTLEPDGEIHLLGTLYHFDDLYNHLQKNEMKESTQVIAALDEEGRSPWPEKFSPRHLRYLKKKMGSINFDTQYQCNADKMRGDIFDYDWMKTLELEEMPKKGRLFVGVDLATGEKEQNDCFAIVLIKVEGKNIYVLKYYEGHLSLRKQIEKVVEWYDEYDPEKVGIETNAYQAVMAQALKEKYPRVRVKRVNTTKDKITRAHKLSARFEAGEVFFAKGTVYLQDHLVLFPKQKKKDLFDALDFAVSLAFGKKGRRKRTKTLGLIGGGRIA